MTNLFLTLFLVSVTPEETNQAFEEARLWLAGIENLSLEEEADGKLQLTGSLERMGDLQKVQEFVKRHPHILNHTYLSPEARAHARKKGGGSEPVASQNSSSSKIEPTIFLEVALVEVKRTALERLGMRMGGTISFDLGMSFKFLQNSGRAVDIHSTDPVRLFLDLAMQKGEARIHAKQSVVTQNGKQGEFQVGGEFPIKVVSGFLVHVEYKNFGLILKFTPRLQKKPMIHLALDSEISEIDSGSSVDGLPIILSKKLKTQVFAKLDETMAMGGLVRSSQSQFTDKIPGLSSLPGLGRLFESDDFKRNKSEAYIFMTPKLMEKPWLPSPEL